MATVSAVVVLLCACLASGFHPHPLPLPFPLPPHVNPIVERPQKHFSGSVCPPDSTCVRQQDCSRQCRPGWDSFGLGSCYWVAPAVAATQQTAHDTCVGLGGHLPVVESAEELPRLLEFGAQWTNATWDGDSATWVWDATGRPVDFSALGTSPAPAGSAATPCLVMVPGPPPRFEPRDCKQTALYLCETGSSSVSRCAGQSERICCAVAADHYGEPCYVDEQGTRCEQRIREGYFPLGESLVRPTEGADGEQLSWAQARQQCRADGGDLLTVDDSQMDKSIIAILSALAPLGATEFYIGMSSDALGQFSYVNGTRAEAGDAFLNFATATDASRPSSCVYYSGAAWSSGDCSTPRDFICHIRRVRHSLRQEPEVPRCGVRQTQGVLGKSGARFHHPPPLLPPPLLPPLGPADDGRRGAAQFGEFTWQAAIWTRSGSAGHEFSCSGALIHPAWVLTSARCVSDAAPADLKVTVGDWNLDESQPVNLPPVALDVTRVRVSPGRVSHGPYGPVLESGRLALLQVTPELDGDEYPHVGPICLPDTSLLQQIHQFRCVVSGWRGGSQPVQQPWGPQPKPDRRDILRKFETGVHHGPECQDEAQHLKRLRQRPQYPPHYPHPYPPIYPPPYPVPYSAAGEREWLEPRSQFSFRPPFLGPPPQQHPGPGASDQPEHYICPRDGRCIPDPGALLACALPPPPSPHQHQHVPLPPHLPLHPPPHLPPFYRSAAQHNDTADQSAAPAAAPSAAGGASEPTSPVDAYEQIAKGFRPPVEKATEKRARRSADAGGSGGPSSPIAAAASAGGAGAAAGGSAAAAPVAAAVTGSAAASAAPFASPRVVVGSADKTDAAASSGAAKPPAGGASGAGAGESAGRSAFVLPHSIIGAFHAAPPPFAPGPHAGHSGDGADPRPSVTGTRHYDAYVLVGVASAVADGCAHGHMIFDDVIQESEFIQQVLHRGG